MSRNNYAGKEVKRTVYLYAVRDNYGVGSDDYRIFICDTELLAGNEYILLDTREICMVVPEGHVDLDQDIIKRLQDKKVDIRVEAEREVQVIEETIQSMLALPAPEEEVS